MYLIVLGHEIMKRNFIKTPRAESSSTAASTIILLNSKEMSLPENINWHFILY